MVQGLAHDSASQEMDSAFQEGLSGVTTVKAPDLVCLDHRHISSGRHSTWSVVAPGYLLPCENARLETRFLFQALLGWFMIPPPLPGIGPESLWACSLSHHRSQALSSFPGGGQEGDSVLERDTSPDCPLRPVCQRMCRAASKTRPWSEFHC